MTTIRESRVCAEDRPRASRVGGRPQGLWRALVLGVGAALLYGSWAYFANHEVGVGAGLRAACVQALLSFTATVVLVSLVEHLFAAARNPGWGFWLAGFGGSCTGALVMASVHGIAGTPNLLLTIAPSLVIGTTFCFVYAAGLRVGQR